MNPLYPLPEVVVEVDRAELAAAGALALGAVRVQQRLSMPALCELTFRDPPGALGEIARLQPGMDLRVSVRKQSVPIFSGQITAIEYIYEPGRGRAIRVRGYDLLHQLRKRQTVRAHVQITLEELARTLVGSLGVGVQTAAPGPVWQRVIQHRQSDFELLVELAERCGLYLSLRDDTLHLLSLAGMGETVPLVLDESLLEARIEINGDRACRSVSAGGWDPSTVETYSGSTSSPRAGRDVDAAVEPALVGGSGQRMLVDAVAGDGRQAEALAQAELDLRSAFEVTFHGIAEGDARLQPGTPVHVDGVAGPVAGRYVLASVNHLIDERMGYICELSSEPPARRQECSSSIATLGIVIDVHDPEHHGRVRARLPTYNDVETDWMSILSSGAGPQTGLVLQPKVDDQVLVLLIHDDPAQGIVLGGLYGRQELPESGAIFTLRTRDGQRIQFDDERRRVRIENNAGSFVELAPGKVQLHSATDLVIEAPGKPITIRGNTIDFERG